NADISQYEFVAVSTTTTGASSPHMKRPIAPDQSVLNSAGSCGTSFALNADGGSSKAEARAIFESSEHAPSVSMRWIVRSLSPEMTASCSWDQPRSLRSSLTTALGTLI